MSGWGEWSRPWNTCPKHRLPRNASRRTLATVKRTKVTAPRTSTTDPEARVMKMPDGGFRPAYNVELATDQAKGVIVGVTVIREGTDAGQALPMQEQVVKRTGQHPGAYLMDGSFATKEDITGLEGTGCHGVRPGAAAPEQTGGGALPAQLRR